MARTFAVGDIHGYLSLLAPLTEQLLREAQVGDTLVFLGDYIDRGPQSRQVVDHVLALQGGGWPGPVVTLLGNHEEMMLDWIRATLPQGRLYGLGMWESNGGLEALASYGIQGIEDQRYAAEIRNLEFLPERHWRWFAGLQLDYQDEHAYYVHGGLEPGKPWDQQGRYVKLWIKDPWVHDTSGYDWGKPVVFGHTPISRQMLRKVPFGRRQGRETWCPLDRPEKIGIDTGSCYGGPLTAVMLPERKFFVQDHGK